MDWISLIPQALAALFIVVVPGLVMGLAARMRGWTLLAAAPLLSVTAIAVAPIFADMLGVGWGVWPLLAFTVVAAMVVGAGSFIWTIGRRRHDGPGGTTTTAIGSVERRIPLMYCVAFLIASLIATIQYVVMLGSPHAFSQTYDNIFHLNAIRWMLDTGNGSSVTFNTMITGGRGPGFYPAAWHDLVVLVRSMTGVSDIVSPTNAAIWVVMAVIWPLGCLFMVRVILPELSGAAIVAAGVLASSFAAFPSLLIGFGVLYPNCLAFALLPTLLGLASALLRLTPQPWPDPPATLICLILACLPGLFLAHPNALLSLVAMLSPMGLVWGWRGARHAWSAKRALAWTYIGLTLLGLGVFALIWRFGYTQPSWSAPNVSETSLAEVILASPLLLRPFWLLGVLVLIGLVVIIQTQTCRWWLGPFIVIVVLWWAVSAMGNGLFRNLLVAGYYNDPYRLAALLPLVLYPLCVVGSQFLFERIGRVRQVKYGSTKVFQTIAVATVLVVMVVGVQFSSAMRQHISWVASTYEITKDSPLVDSDEYQLLQQLPGIVAPGERIAVNPWTGASMAYALEGVLTTTTHVSYNSTPDIDVINNLLNRAESSPQLVCPSVEALNVRYALDFGSREVHGAEHPYPGLMNLDATEGFSVAARVGVATLYRVDACR